jgi:lipopolysaccharide/colanic/teichoic acid biosynthesis glycosyltransferase
VSRLVHVTLAVHRGLQTMRERTVRARFDAEERQVLADDLTRLRRDHGRLAVLRQWPALLRDGVADAATTRRVWPRDTLTRRAGDLAAAGVLALPALVLSAPLALAVRLTSPGPAFVVIAYRGRDGQPLHLRKLRTMTGAAPHRVTGLGRLLRATYLDELPAVLALARGDVTLVGPRAQPAATNSTPLAVRPGLLHRASVS